jgi:hypothetical protein
MTNLILLAAVLVAVESGGNDRAVSPDGHCWGALQETAVFVKDVNRIAGTRYVHADAFDRRKAIEMMAIYQRYYATRARLGRAPTMEDMARIQAGGPDGWRDPHTRAYWRKVAREAARWTYAHD